MHIMITISGFAHFDRKAIRIARNSPNLNSCPDRSNLVGDRPTLSARKQGKHLEHTPGTGHDPTARKVNSEGHAVKVGTAHHKTGITFGITLEVLPNVQGMVATAPSLARSVAGKFLQLSQKKVSNLLTNLDNLVQCK